MSKLQYHCLINDSGSYVTDNLKVIQGIKEIDDKLHSGNAKGSERTKLMFEQMLRGLYLSPEAMI